MELTIEKQKYYVNRLLLSRMRILAEDGFYGLLLMHVTFSLDDSLDTAATNGQRIYFSPKFLDELSNSELDFVLMHEVLHIVLKHCFRKEKRDLQLFNIACDIVVNSNILLSKNMNVKAITLNKYGESMHLTPNREEGYKYIVEEVYDMLISNINSQNQKGWDDHSHWNDNSLNEPLNDMWTNYFEEACTTIENQNGGKTFGKIPLCAERLLKKLKKSQIDWRTTLNQFVQEEIVDYSFLPPDTRFSESPFFLPAFNDTDVNVQNILFMIDTSGSMDDDMITAAYSEVKGALDQFNGKLKGWLGYFDAKVVPPKPFDSYETLINIIT